MSDKKLLLGTSYLTWDDEGECWLHTKKPEYHENIGSWWSNNGKMVRMEDLDGHGKGCKKIDDISVR